MALRSQHFAGNLRVQKASTNRPVMRRGESGDGVELLQEALVLVGYAMPISTKADGSMDGIFGRETDSVVRRFQTNESLGSDGLAGSQVLGILEDDAGHLWLSTGNGLSRLDPQTGIMDDGAYCRPGPDGSGL